jgi:hypothetical protein
VVLDVGGVFKEAYAPRSAVVVSFVCLVGRGFVGSL